MLQTSKLSLHNSNTITTADGADLAQLEGVYEGTSQFQIHITIGDIDQYTPYKGEILQNISTFIDEVIGTTKNYKDVIKGE